MIKTLEVERLSDMALLSGGLNRHLAEIEKQLGVQIEPGDGGFRIEGSPDAVGRGEELLRLLIRLGRTGSPVDEQSVHYFAEKAAREAVERLQPFGDEIVCVNAKGKPIRSKTAGQSRYVKAIREHDICFGIGPAGTGKTYLAVAMAVQAFRRQEVERIILTRPAVEAGEKLGFLPGDLQTKVDPYMRPLYDALFELMGPESYAKNVEKNLIEVSPLAYMRGRTLDSAFIILDEAQNTTMEQMKMFLTRIGFHAKAVVTGDITQVDLPHEKKSGLIGVRPILKRVEGVAFVDLDPSDVVRCGIVQRIIRAYERAEKGGRSREKQN